MPFGGAALVNAGGRLLVNANVVVKVPTRAMIENEPPVALAVKVGALARPEALVVARATESPPVKVPLAPEVGAVKLTTAPTSGLLLPSRTETTIGARKGVPTDVLCGVPDCDVTVAGHPEFARWARTEIVLSPLLVTTRSVLPSPLRSPTAMLLGCVPTPNTRGAWNVPSPLLKLMNTALSTWLPLIWLASARSVWPSPLKSPTNTQPGPLPREKVVAAPKVPSPLPSKIVKLLGSLLCETTRSSLPSPLKSAITTLYGLKAA